MECLAITAVTQAGGQSPRSALSTEESLNYDRFRRREKNTEQSGMKEGGSRMNTFEVAVAQKPLKERLNGGNGFNTAVLVLKPFPPPSSWSWQRGSSSCRSARETMTSFHLLRSLFLLVLLVFTFLFNIHGNAQPDRKHANLHADGIYF